MSDKVYQAAKKDASGGKFAFRVGSERFEVLLPLPGFAVMDLASMSGTTAEDGEQAGLAALDRFTDFLEAALGEEDYKRFRKAANRERMSINAIMDTVVKIAESSGKATQQSSESSPSSSEDSTTSPAAATSAA